MPFGWRTVLVSAPPELVSESTNAAASRPVAPLSNGSWSFASSTTSQTSAGSSAASPLEVAMRVTSPFVLEPEVRFDVNVAVSATALPPGLSKVST